MTDDDDDRPDSADGHGRHPPQKRNGRLLAALCDSSSSVTIFLPRRLIIINVTEERKRIEYRTHNRSEKESRGINRATTNAQIGRLAQSSARSLRLSNMGFLSFFFLSIDMSEHHYDRLQVIQQLLELLRFLFFGLSPRTTSSFSSPGSNREMNQARRPHISWMTQKREREQ